MPSLTLPVPPGTPVTSPYGMRGGGMHTGTDLGAPYGTAITAAADGLVVYNAYEDGAGNTLTLEHDDGTQTRYHHQAERSPIPVGARVRRGERIGTVGSTGHSSGPQRIFFPASS